MPMLQLIINFDPVAQQVSIQSNVPPTEKSLFYRILFEGLMAIMNYDPKKPQIVPGGVLPFDPRGKGMG